MSSEQAIENPSPAEKAVLEQMAKLLTARKKWEEGKVQFNTWLDQVQEDALEPELEIVDAHHHVWDMRELNGYNLMGIFKQQYYMTEELIEDFIGSQPLALP